MVSCEFNSYWRHSYWMPWFQFCTKMSDLCYLRKPRIMLFHAVVLSITIIQKWPSAFEVCIVNSWTPIEKECTVEFLLFWTCRWPMLSIPDKEFTFFGTPLFFTELVSRFEDRACRDRPWNFLTNTSLWLRIQRLSGSARFQRESRLVRTEMDGFFAF